MATVPQRIKVVVADDSEPVRMMLAVMIESLGYEVIEAEDGEQAYGFVLAGGVQIVVSDWLMPRLDGPSLCRKLREAGLDRYIHFILVSVRDSHTDFVSGMDAGADDFLTKPVDIDQLRVRLRAAERIMNLERKIDDRNNKLSQAYQQIRRDLDAAARMQRNLLPNRVLQFGSMQADWFLLPSMFVSGDELNVFHLDQEHVAFYNLDVAGHGVPAAMMSVTLSRMLSPDIDAGLLRERRGEPPRVHIQSPARVAESLNRRFQMTIEDSVYFTMLYGVLELRSGLVRLVQAGHPRPIVTTCTHDFRVGGLACPPIGIVAEVSYEMQEFVLRPGERLFIYSDGITECENPREEQFGEERLTEFLCTRGDASLQETLQSLQHSLQQWRGTEVAGFQDDVSMLALEYRG